MKPVILPALLMFFVFSGISAQDLYTQANAASINNEANTTTGWTTNNRSVATSSSDNPFSGAYSISVASNGNIGGYAFYRFSAVVGQVYNISIWAREGNLSFEPAFANWSGFSNFTTTMITGNSWRQYTWSLTATSTSPEIRVYTAPYSGGQNGTQVLIDNVSILPEVDLDTQSPTAPGNLVASGTTSTSTSLAWTASTDNVGVTGYTVFRDGVNIGTTAGATSFNVSGLTANTAYAFTVTARDAAGNISVASNVANVTTLEGGGGVIPYTSANANLDTVDWQARDFMASRYMGIGTSYIDGYQLAVGGNIIAEGVTVKLQTNWPDFVFKKEYNLPSLKEVEEHILRKGHLLNIPSAEEVEKKGINIGKMDAKLLQKIEELTLYTIAQEKKIQNLEQENKKIDSLAAKLLELERYLKENNK